MLVSCNSFSLLLPLLHLLLVFLQFLRELPPPIMKAKVRVFELSRVVSQVASRSPAVYTGILLTWDDGSATRLPVVYDDGHGEGQWTSRVPQAPQGMTVSSFGDCVVQHLSAADLVAFYGTCRQTVVAASLDDEIISTMQTMAESIAQVPHNMVLADYHDFCRNVSFGPGEGWESGYVYHPQVIRIYQSRSSCKAWGRLVWQSTELLRTRFSNAVAKEVGWL